MRIVSLCPSLTELVFDLGRGADLVGITDWCVHPADRVGAIEKVGGTKTPNVARIVELKPDLVLMNEEENRAIDAQLLATAGLTLHVSMPRDAAATARMVRSIGNELKRRNEAETIALDIEARTQRVARSARGQREVSWCYLIWRKPFMSVSKDTFVSALLDQAGGRNVFGLSTERYPSIEITDLVSRAPEVVFLCTEPFPFKEKHKDELALLTGFARERFVIADGELLSWHGSRTPRGIDYAESLIVAARRVMA
ncbi:MAG TPA: helical backbone metal receptor [Planctomycetota bacterium]|nr:helical backbone metal receptor [Planctomycetota bacterium]